MDQLDAILQSKSTKIGLLYESFKSRILIEMIAYSSWLYLHNDIAIWKRSRYFTLIASQQIV